ncbi:DAN domain family member 5 [Brachionichthys hirsutus]|uniref:DAN domain family member 5 n=1 Tax=Brachionichthys hirsutus TaxID=412623 RepID=UPI00360503F1
MSFPVGFVILSIWTAVAFSFPHNTIGSIAKGSRALLESSGGGPDEAVGGLVKVVQLDPRAVSQSGFFRRGLNHRRALPRSSKLAFPAFLFHGRPGPALAPKAPVSPLHHLHLKSPSDMEVKKRQGFQMWQRAVHKKEKMSLPVNLMDSERACAAVPFTQRVTADGCDTVSMSNKLCFGQCSSLFVPPEGEFFSQEAGTGPPRHRAPCSRCAPSKVRTEPVHLLCGGKVREKRVMVVEECRCETGREEKSNEAAASKHL